MSQDHYRDLLQRCAGLAAVPTIVVHPCEAGALRGALEAAEAINVNAMDAMDAIIREFELPAHTVGLGVKGCVTWSATPVRNYRDYKATDFALAELSWLWGVNRGVLTPPGLDEQWLVSLAHTQEDMDGLVAHFRELAEALRA